MVHTNHNQPQYIQKWEKDLKRKLDNSEWNQIWSSTKAASPNILALEASYKVLTRWYLVPARVAKYLPNDSAQCFRGRSELGTLFHIWWLCPKAQIYWKEIFNITSKLFDKIIPFDPAIALINLKPENITHAQFKLLIQFFTAAKQTLERAWRSSNLIVKEALDKMNNTMTHPKMIAIDMDTIPKFERTWQPWTLDKRYYTTNLR